MYNFSSEGLTKRALEDSGFGAMAKYLRVDDAVKLKSTKRGFKTIRHANVNYESNNTGLSEFYPKREFKCNGKHTKPLNL